MKLIIDIPEEVKRHIDTFKGKFLCGDGFDLIEAIQNGTPLDDVKAEIIYYNDKHCNSEFISVGTVFAIIDKHISKAESEEV